MLFVHASSTGNYRSGTANIPGSGLGNKISPGRVLDLLGSDTKTFERIFWPHLRGAYNLARWLTKNDHDAEDVVQEAFTRAFERLDTFRGGDARVWLMAIVRNTSMSHLRRRRSSAEELWSTDVTDPVDASPSVEQSLIDKSREDQLRMAISALPDDYRETLVLCELEGLAYKEIAAVLNIPIGTVMSRLSRARELLLRTLAPIEGVRD
jgi:RNA polymerase sigma-70 factor, ECF subfamily